MPKSVSCSVLLAAASFFIALSGCSNQTEKGSTPAGNQGQAATAQVRPPRNPLRNAYFGDLHLHSGYSMDAFAMGTRTTPEDAYKYAMGETVEYFGKPQKRIAALDFLALTDHAEYLGVGPETVNPNGAFAKTDWYNNMTSSDPAVAAAAFKKVVGTFSPTNRCRNFRIPKFSVPPGRTIRQSRKNITTPASSPHLSALNGRQPLSFRTCTAA